MFLSNTQLIDMYRKMWTIRVFEYKVKDLFSKGKIGGDLHLSIGQEAVSVGICMALRNGDYVLSNHRGHGHCIAMGVDIKSMMAELFGRKTGLCKGKGGSMHLADFSVGMLGATGVVGANMPLAVGAGLSIRMRKSSQVAVAFFGDGASNQGTFHESINLAAIWDLPVLFVCENNQYAESTPVSQVVRVRNIADRAIAYGIDGIIADGMDVMAVYNAAWKASEKARCGKGPTLIECKTYRYMGHDEGDPWNTYRSKEEVERWKKKDAIDRLRKYLDERAILTEDNAKEIDEDIRKSVEDAVKFAEESAWPDAEDAFRDVFVSSYY